MARYRLQTVVCFIDGGLDTLRHHDEILRPVVVPFIYRHHLMLPKDNTPLQQCYKYVSTTAEDFSVQRPGNRQPHHLHVDEMSCTRCRWTESTHNHYLSRKVLNFSPQSRPNSPQSQMLISNLFSSKFMLPY